MELSDKIKLIPHQPGVYQYYDKHGEIIYVGKAKDLRKRVSSYFVKKKHESRKTDILVKRIVDIQFIVVETEQDALLLENNLIKKYQPKYNVMLKDDKTYPWIVIKNERFPRVVTTRQPVKDGSLYFGPYTSGRMMHTLLDLIKQLFPLRTCNYALSKEQIAGGKLKVCLEYHIGNCMGPCEDKQQEEEYQEYIQEIKHLIKGNANQAKEYLQKMMTKYAEDLAFEKAQLIKDKIGLLENYQSKSTVVSPYLTNIDVISIVSDTKTGFVNYMKVVNGAIVQSFTLELRKKIEETDQELLELGLVELRQRFESTSAEVLVPFKLSLPAETVKWIVPKIGDKKKLLEFSEKNAKYFMIDKHKQERLIDPERHSKRILEQMKIDLRLTELPKHIECFDNSNIQGTNPVSACVVFRDAKPFKKDYRHFNIKTVEGPDDYASMTEAVFRRYKRLLDENQPLPHLLVIDGGKGQLGAALEALEQLGIRGKLPVIGIAKRLEEIYFPGDSIPIYLDKRSESLKVIQFMRNEAHRFGITHHRNKRSKGAITSELAGIKGVGEQTITDLMRTFKSVKRIKEQTLDELVKVVPAARAKLVFDYLKGEG
ncbi:MAG: excinuclease ABC subunit C [Flavobacteriales bacterium]